MLGIKVELNAQSVADTKTKFNDLLNKLQDRANKTTIKINVDIANLRSLNSIMNTIVNDMKRMDSANRNTAGSINQVIGNMRQMVNLQNQINNSVENTGRVSSSSMAGLLLMHTALNAVMQSFRQGVQFTLDLNKAMTEVSIVTGKSQQQVTDLANGYNRLAKEMGTTTTEIAKASVEYYRQGLSQAEVQNRMETTIQYSKVAGLALEESATILTATVNSMDIDIKRASDVFSYLGDATATGADEIGKAFQRVGGSASSIGVEFEKVSSWIAVISSKTRENAESIGNSLKGLMARYQNMKEKGFDEVDGTQINQVSKALSTIDVNIIDKATGQFRNFGTVMDEVGGKWKDLDSRQKAYIATTFAGTHQQSRFLNLMDNYKESVDLYNESLNATGTTQEKYNLYMQGTEAHLNKLKATAEATWLKLFNSEAMRNGIDALTELLNKVNRLIDSFGGLKGVIGVVAGAMFAFRSSAGSISLGNNGANFTGAIGGVNSIIQAFKNYRGALEEIKMNQGLIGDSSTTLGMRFQALTGKLLGATLKTVGLTVATTALNAVIGMGVGLAISALVAGLTHWINKADEAKKATEELMVKTVQSNKEVNNLSKLYDDYDKLTQKQSNGELDTEEKKELLNITSQLTEVLPGVVEQYDQEGNAIKLNTEEVRKQIQAKKDLASANAKLAVDNVGKNLDKERSKFEDALTRQKELKDAINSGNYGTRTEIRSDAVGNVYNAEVKNTSKDIEKEFADVNKQVEDGQKYFKDYNANIIILNKETGKMQQVVDLSTGALVDQTKALNDNTEKKKTNAEQIQGMIKTESELQKSLSENLDKIDEYGKIMNSINDKGNLTSGEKSEIIKKNPELIPYLSNLNSLSSELARRIEDIKSKSEGTFATIQVKEEANSISDLVSEYENLSSETNLSAEQQTTLSRITEELKGRVEGFTDAKKDDYIATQKNITLAKDRIKTLDTEQTYLQLCQKIGKDKARAMIVAEIEETNNQRKQTEARLQDLGSEFRVRQAILNQKILDGSISRETAQSINAENQKIMTTIINEMNKLDSTPVRSVTDAIKAMDDADAKASASAKTFGGVVNNLTQDTSESSNAMKEAKTQVKEYENALKELANTIKGLDYQLGTLDENSQAYIDVLDQKQKAIEQEIALTKQAIEVNGANADSLKGVADAYTSANSASTSYSGSYADIINKASQKYGVDANLISAVIQQESGFNNSSHSGAGAMGLMQLMPGTARELGVSDPWNPEQNIMGGTKYLKQMLNMFGDVRTAVGHYNSGPGGNLTNSETSNYMKKVMGYYQQFAGGKSIPNISYSGSSSTSSGAEDIISKVEGWKGNLIDFQKQLDEIKLQKLNSELGALDVNMDNVDSKLTSAKNNANIWDKDLKENSKYMFEESKIINEKYGILYRKEQMLSNAINSGNYNGKTISDLKRKLADVKNEELQTIRDLHDAFNDMLVAEYNGKVQQFVQDLDYLKGELENIDDKQIGSSSKKISLNREMLGQQEQIKQKTLEQLRLVEDMLSKEKYASTRQVWVDQYNQLVKALQEANKSIEEIEDSLNGVLDSVEKNVESLQSNIMNAIKAQYEAQKEIQLKPINDEIKSLQKQIKDLQDDTPDKKKNLVDLQNELSLWKKDDSIFSKSKQVELEKQIKDLTKELQIKELQDKVDTKQEETKSIEDGVTEALKNDNLRTKALEMIKKGDVAEINDYLIKWLPDYKDKLALFGNTFKTSLETETAKQLQEFRDFKTIASDIKKLIEEANKNQSTSTSNDLSSKVASKQTAWVTGYGTADDALAQQYKDLGWDVKEINDSTMGQVMAGDRLVGLAGTLYGDKTSGTKVTGANSFATGELIDQDIESIVGAKTIPTSSVSKPTIHQTGANAQITRAMFGDSVTIIEDFDQFVKADRASTSQAVVDYLSGFGISPNRRLTSGEMYAYQGTAPITNSKPTSIKPVVNLSGANAKIARAMFGDLIDIVPTDKEQFAGATRVETSQMLINWLRSKGVTPYQTFSESELYKFKTGGNTERTGWHWLDGESGRPERVLTQAQTQAFNDLVYKMLPKLDNIMLPDSNMSAIAKVLDNRNGININEPIVKNDIQIINNTPFDVENNMDNLSNAIKQELRTSGYRLRL